MRKQSSFSEDKTDLQNILSSITENRTPISILLDGIQDDRNLGSIFRIADGARLKHIYLYNCSENFKSKNFKRTARSTQKYLSFSNIDLDQLKQLATTQSLCAIEKTNDSTPYKSIELINPTILVLGNEQFGVSQEILDLCSQCMHIPMLGVNSSLNVATALGIVVYHFV